MTCVVRRVTFNVTSAPKEEIQRAKSDLRWVSSAQRDLKWGTYVRTSTPSGMIPEKTTTVPSSTSFLIRGIISATSGMKSSIERFLGLFSPFNAATRPSAGAFPLAFLYSS